MCRSVTLPAAEWLETCMPGDPGISSELLSSTFKPFHETIVVDDARMLCSNLREGFSAILRKIGATGYYIVATEHLEGIEEGCQRLTSGSDECATGCLDGFPTNGEPIRNRALYMLNGIHETHVSSSLTEKEVPHPVSNRAANPKANGSSDAGTQHVPKATSVWPWAEFLVEVKNAPGEASSASNLPADSPEGTFYDWNPPVEHAQEMCARQHRSFVFVVSVRGNLARLFQFDPAGIIASTPFNYVEHHAFLSSFVHRYVRMSRSERGFDPTATLVGPEERKTFQALVNDATARAHVRTSLEKAVSPGWPIHVLSLDAPWSLDGETPMGAENPTSLRRFIVGKPHYITPTMFGKSTRGYLAYDIARGTVVFLKDCWRDDLGPNHLTELKVYLELATDPSKRPMPIPTLLGGGDLLDDCREAQTTLTQVVFAKCRSGYATAGRVHTRFVFKEVCRSIESFGDTRELASVVYDALEAHERAWSHHGVLHCDVSPANILILDVDEGSMRQSDSRSAVGLLCDWDLARRRTDGRHPDFSAVSTRSGTWQTLSATLLLNPEQPPQLSDDLESAYHVLNWCSTKYLLHRISSRARLRKWMADVYDDATEGLGGELKRTFTKYGDPFVELACAPDHPFQQLLAQLGEICKQHHKKVPPKGTMQDAMTRTPEHGDGAGAGRGETGSAQPLAHARGIASLGPALPHARSSALQTHDHVLDAFSHVLGRTSEWPEIKKLPDQLPYKVGSSSAV